MFRFRFFGIIFIPVFFFAVSCTKIDSTSLGSDLIPPVDNVHTFDTLLNIVSNNYLFNDSTRLAQSEYHAIGTINNDPLFGSTTASLYTEMKPSFFPVSFYAKDSLVSFDSVILRIAYKGSYGDSMLPVNFKVSSLNESMNADTLKSPFPAYYKLDKTFTAGVQLGLKSYSQIRSINDPVPIMRGDRLVYNATKQVRIPLNKAFFSQVFTSDPTNLKSDSALKTILKGFKVEANVVGSPGALCYFSLPDTATKLEFYYRTINRSGGIDTVSASFVCGANSGHANNIVRARAGSEMQNHLTVLPEGDSLLYIQTTPGTYARLKIPGLPLLSNRIVHRAELKIIQVPDDPSIDGKLSPTPYLYLDMFDTASDRTKYNPIPYELNPAANYTKCFPTNGGIDYRNFGGIPVARVINGQQVYEYTFNLSRYVQNIVTRHIYSADLRLSSALFAEYFDCTGVAYIPVTGNRVAEGRIKLGGGTKAGSKWPYKMQLRIIYSKL